MDSLSIICIVIGILAIVIRGPLIFVPRATLRFYDRLILSSNARVRAVGVVNAILAIALLLLPSLNEGRWPVCSTLLDGSWRPSPSGSWFYQTGSGYFPAPYSTSSSPQGATLSCASLAYFKVVLGVVLLYVGVYVV